MSDSSEESVCDRLSVISRRSSQSTNSHANGVLDRKLVIREESDVR